MFLINPISIKSTLAHIFNIRVNAQWVGYFPQTYLYQTFLGRIRKICPFVHVQRKSVLKGLTPKPKYIIKITTKQETMIFTDNTLHLNFVHFREFLKPRLCSLFVPLCR